MQLHELAEHDFGLVGVPERREPGLERLDLPVVVGAPDVDQVPPAAGQLVAVVGEVVAQVGGRAVGLHEDTVAAVAVGGRPQPAGPVVLVGLAARREVVEDRGDVAPLVEGPFGEPRVEVHADATEVVAELTDDLLVAPLAGLLQGDVVSELGPEPRREFDQVGPLVAVVGGFATLVPREQGRTERVELAARVVQVVLAVHLGTLGGEDVREGVTHRDPTASARVERPGRVRGDELEVDPLPGQVTAATPLVAEPDDGAQDLVEPAGRDREVEEPAGDVHGGEVRHVGCEQRGSEPLGRLDRRDPGGLGHPEGDVRRPVAVLPVLGGFERDATRRLWEAGGAERGAHGVEKLVADHGCCPRDGAPGTAWYCPTPKSLRSDSPRVAGRDRDA